MSDHQHEPESTPMTGTGYAVCWCGATLRYEKGKPVGEWHTCKLCIHESVWRKIEQAQLGFSEGS